MITNTSSSVVSSSSQNSSLFSEIHHLAINNPLVNDKIASQIVTDAEVEPNDHFEQIELSSIYDTLNQLCSIIDPSSLNTNEPSKFVLKLFLFNLNIT